MGVGNQRLAPAALLPGLTQYQLYRRLGRPQVVLRIRKISFLQGLDPRTVQPLVSRCTNQAIPARRLK